MVDKVAITPPGGTNERDLNLGRDVKLMQTQKLAMFPPRLQPVGGTTMKVAVPVDRAGGLKAYEAAERPDAARQRLQDAAANLIEFERLE
jgi:hypothetical protein